MNRKFDVFLSYSRKDNDPLPGDEFGWVTALHEEILKDHKRFSTEPLRIFLDTSEIRDMDDWRHRILEGLRSSSILLVCLSPNYFSSEYCRWEFDEYVQRQVHQSMGSDAFAEVYFVEVPGSPEQEVAKGWHELLSRKNYTDLRPWYPRGVQALREEAVRTKLAALGNSLWERIQRSRMASSVPGNLRRVNPHFIGRATELRQLHESLKLGTVGVVTAMHGLGGQGKTELATAYAHHWSFCYPGGLWVLSAEGKTELLPSLGDLCEDLGIPVSQGENETGSARGRRVLAELKRRATEAKQSDPDQGAACLVLLDNVSEPSLLSEPQLSSLPREDWLRVVATTREGPNRFPADRKKSLTFIPVDGLSEEDAARLLEDHQIETNGKWPAASAAADAEAARAIARELGGFTLAVESIGIYLGLHPEIRPADFLQRLRSEGLAGVDSLPADADIGMQMQHREKQLGLVLVQTFSTLSERELAVLDFASLLPPDWIPWPWLRVLVGIDFPEFAQPLDDVLSGVGTSSTGHPDPWMGVRRRLEGLRLLTPGDHPQIAHGHRLVMAHIRERMGDPRRSHCRSVLGDFLDRFAAQFERQSRHSTQSLWVLTPLQEAVMHLGSTMGDVRMAENSTLVGSIELQLGRMERAWKLLELGRGLFEKLLAREPNEARVARGFVNLLSSVADFLSRRGQAGDGEKALENYQRSLEVREQLLEQNPQSAQAARDVSGSLNKVGDFLLRRGQAGDAEKALENYQRSLEVCERLLEQNPQSAQAARDVSGSLNKVGDFLSRRGQAGDAEKARENYQRSLEVCERLLEQNPQSAQAARDVSVSLNKVGDFLSRRGQAGDGEKALENYQRSLEVRERLLEQNPQSAQAARDVSVSLDRVGDFLSRRGQAGDGEKALKNYQRGLEVCERLLEQNPQSAQAARDVSVSLEKVGDFLSLRGQAGDGEKALENYLRSLQVRERLLEQNPQSAEAARDVSVSLEKVGDFLLRRGQAGDGEKALENYQRGLEVCERLLEQNPQSAQAARDVSVSLSKVGDFLSRRGQAGDGEKALENYQRGLEVCERLLEQNPQSAQAARDVSVSLSKVGDFLSLRGQAGDGEKALENYQRSLEVCERLLEQNPQSAQAARDVSVSLSKVGDFLSRRGQAGDGEKALENYQRGLEVCERLLEQNPQSAEAARDVSVSLNKVADFLSRRGQPGDGEKALENYQRSLEVCERLLEQNPQSAEAARDISVSLERVGDFLSLRGQAGDGGKALEKYQRSLEVCERLLEQNPQSAEAARDVSVSLERVGDFLSRRGQPGDGEKALENYRRSLEVRERLLEQNPQSAQAARDVSVSLSKVGDFLSRSGQAGDGEKALENYLRSLEVRERLLEQNPQSAEAARDVSVSLEKVGDFLSRRGQPGDGEKALENYQRSLEVCERLLEQNPQSAEAARDVSVSLEKVGDFLSRRGQAGDGEKALELQQRAVEIGMALFTSNRQSVFYGRTLAVSLFLAFQRAQGVGQEKKAIEYLSQCFAVLDDLVQGGATLDPEILNLHTQLTDIFSKD